MKASGLPPRVEVRNRAARLCAYVMAGRPQEAREELEALLAEPAYRRGGQQTLVRAFRRGAAVQTEEFLSFPPWLWEQADRRRRPLVAHLLASLGGRAPRRVWEGAFALAAVCHGLGDCLALARAAAVPLTAHPNGFFQPTAAFLAEGGWPAALAAVALWQLARRQEGWSWPSLEALGSALGYGQGPLGEALRWVLGRWPRQEHLADFLLGFGASRQGATVALLCQVLQRAPGRRARPFLDKVLPLCRGWAASPDPALRAPAQAALKALGQP